MVDLSFYINQLQTNVLTIQSTLSHLPNTQLIWRPAPEIWSLLEVICHLRDEEKEDFRARLQSVLENPLKEFSSIDPIKWVKDRNYSLSNFQEALKAFVNERNNSIQYLQSLKNPHWENAYLHPKLGPMSAKFILANWLAHDYLHIKQITKLKYDYLKEFSKENLSYAGDWN